MPTENNICCSDSTTTLEQLDMQLCGLLDDKASGAAVESTGGCSSAVQAALQLSRRSLEAVLRALHHVESSSLTLDTVSAAGDNGQRLHSRAMRVASNACGLIMSSVHNATRAVEGGSLVVKHPSSDPSVQQECAFLIALLLCDVATCSLLQPSNCNATTHCHSDTPLEDLRKTILVCSRALCRCLSVDLCGMTLSADGSGDGMDSGANGPHAARQRLRLWTDWLPVALRCEEARPVGHGRAPGCRSDEEYRLAVIMLDALRRWCLDVHSSLQGPALSPTEGNPQVHDAQGSGQTSEGSARMFHYWVVARLARSVSEIALPELLLSKRPAPSPRLGLSGVVALPINVLEGFLNAWSRLAQLLPPASVESPTDDTHAATPMPWQVPGSDPQEQLQDSNVKRTLAFHEHDDDGGSCGIDHIAPTNTILPLQRPVPMATTLPPTDTPDALKALLQQDPTRALSMDDVRLVMAQHKRAREVQLQEAHSMVAALQAHNTVVAKRIAARVVKTKLTHAVLAVAKGSTTGCQGTPGGDDGSLDHWAVRVVASHERVMRRIALMMQQFSVQPQDLASTLEQMVVASGAHRETPPGATETVGSVIPAASSGNETLPQHAGVVVRVRSSSAVETFDHDARLAREEEEVDRLVRTVRTFTPRCRTGSRMHPTLPPATASLVPLVQQVGADEETQGSGSQRNAEDSLLFVSPLSDTNKSP